MLSVEVEAEVEVEALGKRQKTKVTSRSEAKIPPQRG
jgi:hypothetical protein